jgi:hypothetical protein
MHLFFDLLYHVISDYSIPLTICTISHVPESTLDLLNVQYRYKVNFHHVLSSSRLVSHTLSETHPDYSPLLPFHCSTGMGFFPLKYLYFNLSSTCLFICHKTIDIEHVTCILFCGSPLNLSDIIQVFSFIRIPREIHLHLSNFFFD